MSRKRNPYIPLFTHDIMSSAKCRRLSMRATGLYLWLLCLMNERPQQGRWALSTNEDHPTWKNSLTYRALQNPDKYGRLQMFATLMARQFLPWKSGQVLKALQELYRFKLIVVEDDAIIQPRMYRDNGFELREDTMKEYLKDNPNDPNDDPENDLADDYRQRLQKGGKKGADKRTVKGTKKDPEKVHEIHAPAPRAESESENNNKNSIGSSKGGVGDFESPDKRGAAIKRGASQEYATIVKGEKSDDVKTDAAPSVKSDTPQDKPAQIPVADCPPTLEQIQAYMQEQGELGRIFRYITAEEYYDEGCKSGWMQRGGRPLYDWKAQLRSFEAYRRNHGDTPVAARGQQPTTPKQGDPVQATPPKDGKYRKW